MGLKSAHDWLSLKSMKSIINITTVTWLLLLLSDYTKAFVCVDHNKLWEILQEKGIPDTLPASCETSMQVKKQQLELNME